MRESRSVNCDEIRWVDSGHDLIGVSLNSSWKDFGKEMRPRKESDGKKRFYTEAAESHPPFRRSILIYELLL